MPGVLERVQRVIESRPVRSLLVVMAVLVPMTVAVCYACVDMWRRSSLDQALEQTRRDLARKGHDTVQRVEVEFFKVRMLSVLLASDPRVLESLRAQGATRPGELDLYLRNFARSLRLRRAYVLDDRAACIASDDHASLASPMGTTVGDRPSFDEIRQGRPATEFQAGGASAPPGFRFAAPVRVDGEVLGAVVVQVDLETLSDHIRFSSAFVTDDQGVVALAGAPEHLLRVVPDAPARTAAPERLRARYGRDAFASLPLRVETMNGAEAFRLDDQAPLSLRQTFPLAQAGFVAHVFEEIGGTGPIQDGFLLRFALAALGSCLSLTLVLAGGVYAIRDAFQRRELLKLNAELQQQAQRDVLTGCYNRRKFDEALRIEFKRSERGGQTVALALLDLDHFKLVNDSHGHGVGDCMLAHVAEILRRELRESDVLARIGGEEFAVILPETDEAQACAILDRLRERVAAAPLLAGDVAVRQTVSAGVAAGPGGQDSQVLLREADLALYAAKKGGRNRVARASAMGQAGGGDAGGLSRLKFD